jgi:hypothetical protein
VAKKNVALTIEDDGERTDREQRYSPTSRVLS